MLFPRNDHRLGGQRLLGKCILKSSPALPGQRRDPVEPCPLPGCFTMALQNLPQGTVSLIKTSYLGPGTSSTIRCSSHFPWKSHSHQGVPCTLGPGGRRLFFFNKCLQDNGRLNPKHLSTFTKVCHQLWWGQPSHRQLTDWSVGPLSCSGPHHGLRLAHAACTHCGQQQGSGP